MLDRKTVDFVTFFLGAYPSRSALMVGLLIVAGFAEGVGVITLLPVLEVAVGSGGDEASAISLAVADFLALFGIPPTLPFLLSLIVLAMAAKGVFRWLAMKQVGYTVAQIGTDLRLRLIRALMKARWSHFSSHPTGHFANAISTEAHRASGAYRQACSAMAGMIQVAVYLAVVFLVSWEVALVTIFVGSAVVLLLRRFIDMSRSAGQEQTLVMQSLIRRLTEALPGIKPVKAMAREEHLLPLLEEEAEGFNQAQQRQVLASESLRSFQEPILVLVIALGLFGVLTWGAQPFSAVLVMVFLFYRVVGRLNQVQSEYQDITLGESAFWSLSGLMEDAEMAREEPGGTLPPPPLREGIRFRGVSFAYGETRVLDDVDLLIPSGRFVALIGPSGSGKTTLADLVSGLHRPDRGEIWLDDVPLGEVDLLAWRRQIGYVPQDMLLFNDSIYRNVTLGNEAFSRDDARYALEAAGAWGFVSSLPEGMDRKIGEMGTKLSGGQRQRIAIARALVGRPKVLILDEATTALDPATEAAICSSLRKLRGEVTILAISHQPALKRAADLVYEVSRGGVTTSGSSEAIALAERSAG